MDAKVFERTTTLVDDHGYPMDPTTDFVSVADGLATANFAMMGQTKRDVKTMSAGSGRYDITYKDGRRVVLVLVANPRLSAPKVEQTEEAPVEQPRTAVIYPGTTGRVVTVKGKDYVLADGVRNGKSYDKTAGEWMPTQYVTYWSVRNGERFGATRTAGSYSKPGTTGRAIWDAASK